MTRTEVPLIVTSMQELSIDEFEEIGFDVDEWNSMF